MLSEVNWLAVLVSGVAYFMLGGIWFMPQVFGKLWDQALGFKRPTDWKPSTIYYLGPLLGCLVAALATAVLLSALAVSSAGEALTFGLIAGFGYTGAVSVVNAITPITPKPLQYGLVTGAYHLVGLMLVSWLIFVMS